MQLEPDDTADPLVCTRDEMSVDCPDPANCPGGTLRHDITSECRWCPHERLTYGCSDDLEEGWECPHWHREKDIDLSKVDLSKVDISVSL